MARPPLPGSEPRIVVSVASARRRWFVFCASLCLAAACTEEGGQLAQVDTPDQLVDPCPPDIDACSDEGASRCVDGGKLATCRELTRGCLGWSEPQACPLNQACQADACVLACPAAACTVPEARRCASADARQVERCADGDGDGCLEWVAAARCGDDQVCSLGGCADACADECAGDARRCEQGAVVACADHDADGCREWGGASPCPSACALGVCVETCRDECGAVGLTRCDGPAVATCQRDVAGCLVWGPPDACPAGASCSLGACAETCVDECVAGAPSCEAGGVVRCGEHDGDPCLDRALPVACSDGQSCSGGACGTGCSDECTTEGARACDAIGRAVRECRRHDADPCLEWVVIATCAGDDTCSNGVCAGECVDECAPGEARCEAGSTTRVETCGDGDVDPCREWVHGEDCAASARVCAAGACADGCTDECDAATCQGDAVVPCGEFDGDACRDRGTAIACEAGQRCVAGTCEAAPAPTGVKIAEVLYQSEGADDDVFIELGGPPHTSLAGFTLVAVNGADGGEYARLALGGSLDGAGRFVIAHPLASPHIADWADLTSPFADLQNGPDNLVLRWGADTVDALGYGAFSAGDHFLGESRPAPAADNGVSLARVGALMDTDDNAADFTTSPAPTPGRPFEAATRPRAHGDLIVTELMIDPSARPDTQGEWFELLNPTPSTWDLAGCIVESDPSERHTLAASILVGPGEHVVFARSAEPGFAPDHVLSGITLANDEDALALICDDEFIDLVVWERAPTGASLSLDPTFTDPDENDDVAAWCPAPVEAAAGQDAGTPGAPNPPCPDRGGTYEAVALDSEWGSCDASSDWHYLTFEGAPRATGPATLTFQWWSVLCELYADAATIEVQLADGASWTTVGDAALTDEALSCEWRDEVLALHRSDIDAARSSAGRIEARFRITSGCPLGVSCGLLGLTLPSDCARVFTLTYPY